VPSIDVFFLPLQEGLRFCIFHPATNKNVDRGAILFVHPFAEEMNKARRMAALQARAFADAGWAVLQIDLFGCGDSSGDFADVTWQQWIQDVIDAAQWLRSKLGHTPVLWGLRTGCLVALEAARHIGGSARCVLWHPVLSGKQFLQQFLRLKIANQLGSEAALDRVSAAQLRDQLKRGETIEIGGYPLSPALALGVEAADLQLPALPSHVAWLELSNAAQLELSPASRSRIQAWEQAGHEVEAAVVEGPRFWQTVEISECPSLVGATLSMVQRWQA
jgi:exosortase A-associated hydrolase 2